MENVSTAWNLSHFRAICESIHTYDTFYSVKLVDFFVVLSELYDRNQLLILLNDCLMHNSSQCFLLIPPPRTTGIIHNLLSLLLTNLCNSLLSYSFFSIHPSFHPLNISIIHVCVMDTMPIDFTFKSEKHETARRAKATEKDHD